MITFLRYFLLFASIIAAICGIVYSYHTSKPIFSGRDTSFRKVILNSLVTGLSGSALMFAVIMIIWFTDQSQILTYTKIFQSCIFSIVIGILIFLASLWRFFITGKYRDILVKKN